MVSGWRPKLTAMAPSTCFIIVSSSFPMCSRRRRLSLSLIHISLGHPTINEFSSFVNISPPNAAYKINNLIQKGYVTKRQSPDDKREYHLYVTQKYIDYYNVSYRYLSTVMDRIKQRFPAEDVAKLEEMLDIISNELMPELDPALSARNDL